MPLCLQELLKLIEIVYRIFVLNNDLFVYILFWDVEDNALMDREESLRTKTVQCVTPPSFVHMIMIC